MKPGCKDFFSPFHCRHSVAALFCYFVALIIIGGIIHSNKKIICSKK